jgi:hypothetical protein
MKTPDLIAATTALVTLAGVVVVYLQLRALSQQIKLQHFSDYTKRYQEIALHFPEDINVSNFVLTGREDYNQTMRYMRAYFDLSYEEWDLSQKKLIDPAFWGTWKSGIEFALSKPAFQQGWQAIRRDTRYGPEFEDFVDRCINRTSS